MVVTTKFRLKLTNGMLKVLKPIITMLAVYAEPPPSPTDEYAAANIKNSEAITIIDMGVIWAISLMLISPLVDLS